MKRSIGEKVRLVVLSVSLLAIISVGSIMLYGLFSTSNYAKQTSDELGHQAALDAEDALVEQSWLRLLDVSREKANHIETKFGETARYTSQIADTATKIYNNPENYTVRIPPYPINGNDELAAQLMYAPGKSINSPGLREETGMLGNVQDLLIEVSEHDPLVASAYVASESGIVIMADSISSAKFSEGSTEANPYNAFERPWYIEAKEKQHLIFTDVIYDVNGGGACVICAQPFYQGDTFMGVAGVGSYLSDLNETVMDTQIYDSGYAFILDNNGQVLVSSKEEGELQAYPEEKVDLRQSSNAELAELAEGMMAGQEALWELTVDGEVVYIACSPLTTLGWSFATVIERDDVLEPAVEIQNGIVDMTDEATEGITTKIQLILTILAFVIAIVLAIVLMLGLKLSNKLTEPITTLMGDVRNVGNGKINYVSNIHTGDEIEELSTTFESMTVKLKEYIANLTAVTAEKERISAELNVAAQIQADMLPSIFPPFPERHEFDIYATMEPAKEVGGDFYDFFMVDDDHLAVVIADVSGKGVPAALFMVIAKTLIKNHAQAGESPADSFTNANRQLCENNEAGLFVTAWMGILTISTGEFIYVNAGHNPPLLRRANGEFEYMKIKPGFVLAGMSSMKYRQAETQLLPGDMLYLYTDGVTEATDTNEELYGEERLLTKINQCKDADLKGILKGIKDDIEVFVKGEPAFDDVTMLLLKINPSEAEDRQEKQMTIQARVENLQQVLDFVNSELEGCDCPAKTQMQINLAVEEIYVNIAHYAYAPEEGDVTIRCDMDKESRQIAIEFIDKGKQYNPLEQAEPDITLSAQERKIGGLGIYMVKKYVDDITYEYQDSQNILKICKQINKE